MALLDCPDLASAQELLALARVRADAELMAFEAMWARLLSPDLVASVPGARTAAPMTG